MKRFLCMLLCLALLPLPGALAETTFRPANAAQAQELALELAHTCAFSVEYGNSNLLKRWETPIRLYVGGSPTNQDKETIAAFVLQLAYRVPTMPNVTIVSSRRDANVTLFFAPLDELDQHVTNYVEGNWGIFNYWTSNNAIVKAEIAIASDVTNQRSRNHLIKEELVGALGLTNDHDMYADSILYQEWTTTQELSEVDWLLLNMIYHPEVTPGMTWRTFYTRTYRRITDR